MAIIPMNQAEWLCRGCDNTYRTHNEAIGHRRRPDFRSCKGAGIDIVLPSDAVPIQPESPPPEAEGGAVERQPELPQTPQQPDEAERTEERRTEVRIAGEDGRSARMIESSLTPGGDGARVMEPTSFEVKVAVPASLFTMFDTFKQHYAYDRSFGRWLVEMASDHCAVVDIEVLAVVGRRRAAATEAEREAAHAG